MRNTVERSRRPGEAAGPSGRGQADVGAICDDYFAHLTMDCACFS